MPDWEELVRQRLAGLALDAAERDEVHAELAAHLEESYESLRTKGLPEQAAMRQTLSQVTDWQDLQRRIDSARSRKDTMTNRVKQFWLPGLLTFLLSTSMLALIQIYGPRPWAVTLRGVLPLGMLYIPWLLLLPLVGATGAYLSHRAGGSGRAVFASILFPVLPFFASILTVLPVALLLDRFIAHNIAPMSLVIALLGWVLVPGIALLAGGLPVHLYFSQRLSQRGVASN